MSVRAFKPKEVPAPIDAVVDGRRVRVVAVDEIVLECGEASLTLRRDGTILLRGTRVESAAVGVHRIRGASVRIN